MGLEQDDGTVGVHYYARGVTQSLKLTRGLSAKEFYQYKRHPDVADLNLHV